ncbi:MAG: OmpH family outer membrane protein [Bacteroidota bacterium]
MKNLSIILNAILFVAVAVLFYLVLSDGSAKTSKETSDQKLDEVQEYPIAYINMDSLLMEYEYAQKLNEDLLRKEESSRADFNEQARVFQEDMQEFQRKVQNNAFLNLERAQNEERRLREKEQELQELNQQMSNELRQQQNEMNEELNDTIASFLKEYTKEHPLKLVLSNTMGDNVLYANKALNITGRIVKKLNQRYEEQQENE